MVGWSEVECNAVRVCPLKLHYSTCAPEHALQDRDNGSAYHVRTTCSNVLTHLQSSAGLMPGVTGNQSAMATECEPAAAKPEHSTAVLQYYPK